LVGGVTRTGRDVHVTTELVRRARESRAGAVIISRMQERGGRLRPEYSGGQRRQGYLEPRSLTAGSCYQMATLLRAPNSREAPENAGIPRFLSSKAVTF